MPSTEPGVRRNGAREIAAELECEVIQEIGREEAPIRGGAAVRGVTCDLDGTVLDVFQRSSEPIEEVDQLVGARPGRDDACGWLLVGDEWFITSSDRDALEAIAGRLSGVVRPVIAASPPASYEIPGCREGQP